MRASRPHFALSLVAVLFLTCSAYAQTLSSGDITVRLTGGLDSSTQRVGQVSQGVVTKSTNPAVTARSIAAVQLVADPAGGFTVQLVRLTSNGQLVHTASTGAVLAPDTLGRLRIGTRQSGSPQDAVSGARVFLPQDTLVRFTLVEPSPALDSSKPRVQTVQTPVGAPQLPFVNWTAKVYPPLAQDVKTACEATDNTSQAYCYAVLMSLYDSYLFAVDAYSASMPCIPEDATAEQLKKAFLDYTTARPTQLGGNIALFYSLAINEAFPCPKAPAAKHSAAKKKSQ